MANSKRLFSLPSPHGPGGVFFAWQKTSGGYLATTGYDQIVNIYNRWVNESFWIFLDFFLDFFVILLYFFRHAEIIDQVRLPGMATMFG